MFVFCKFIMQSDKLFYIYAANFLFSIFVGAIQSLEYDDMSVDEFLKYVNSPAVHKYKDEDGDTILCVNLTNSPCNFYHQDEDGDTILCVRLEDQLSLRSQPRLSHSIKKSRSLKRDGNKSSHDRLNNSLAMKALGQNTYSSSCPPHTLAFREVKKEDVLRMGGVSAYIKKSPPPPRGNVHTLVPPPRGNVHTLVGNELATSHEHAVVEFTFEEAVVETSAANSIWKPFVTEDGHFSLSQVWVSEKNRTESIEAGWHVHPVRYGDYEPRFFIYWTADRYQGTGCYNTYCPGFVVLNDFDLQGKPLKATRYLDPDQYELPITIQLSESNGGPAWYLIVNDKVVGYWPSKLFSSLSQSSSLIVYGGEVSYESKGRFGSDESKLEPNAASVSRTDMGSGHFPEGRWRSSASIRQIHFYGNSANAVDGKQYLRASKPKCYNVTAERDDGFGGLHIFYGGPGSDAPYCQID